MDLAREPDELRGVAPVAGRELEHAAEVRVLDRGPDHLLPLLLDAGLGRAVVAGAVVGIAALGHLLADHVLVGHDAGGLARGRGRRGAARLALGQPLRQHVRVAPRLLQLVLQARDVSLALAELGAQVRAVGLELLVVGLDVGDVRLELREPVLEVRRVRLEPDHAVAGLREQVLDVGDVGAQALDHPLAVRADLEQHVELRLRFREVARRRLEWLDARAPGLVVALVGHGEGGSALASRPARDGARRLVGVRV